MGRTAPRGASGAWTPAAELHVSDPAAVALLWHPAKRVHLRPFLGQPAGLADAARSLGIQKTAMSYWIRRLLDTGLIRPCPEALAGGRRVPQYRCVADRLRLSLADAPLASHEAMFDDVDARWHPQTRRALGRAIARQARWLDLVIESTGAAGLATQLVPGGPGAPADDFLYYRGRLWLDAGERDRLRAELDALWTRYAALSDRSKPHALLLHLVAVPEAPTR
ncbi:MAG: hypothetical protein KF788_09845 [Piscinibacter sp.]|nr:hypothetical protein [Piscinibacter sp.]